MSHSQPQLGNAGAAPRAAGSDRAAICGLSRRHLLRKALAGTAFASAGLAATAGSSRAALPDTPEAALQQLIAGNRRYVAGELTSPKADLQELRSKTVEKQRPFAAVLSCADSRVPVEWVFDQAIGQLLVTRVAGNIATPEIIASLEYGVVALGTRVILVLGHGNCGAVGAAIGNKPQPGQISGLFAPIRPAIDEAGTNLDAAIKANARRQAKLLREASPPLAEAIGRNLLKVASAYYDLASGRVQLLD